MSNKFQLRPALAGVALLAAFTLASCGGGNKPADTASTDTTTTTTTATNPAAISSAAPSAPAVPPSPEATSAKVTPPSTTTTTTSKTTTPTTAATLSPEAQQLGVKPQNATTCPTAAPIKGKLSKKRGLIYHVPKSPDFNATKPDLCFSDIATAEKAGFRAPK